MEAAVSASHHAPGVHHHVGRLQVAVNDALVVDGLEAFRDLDAHVEGLRGRERPLLTQDLAEVHAVQEGHRDVAQRAVLAVLVDAADVLVAHAARQLDLGAEAAAELGRVRHLRAQHLEGDRLLEQAVVGLVDHAHPALAQGGEDLVPGRHHAARYERLGAQRHSPVTAGWR
jgi:hypothetical protein